MWTLSRSNIDVPKHEAIGSGNAARLIWCCNHINVCIDRTMASRVNRYFIQIAPCDCKVGSPPPCAPYPPIKCLQNAFTLSFWVFSLLLLTINHDNHKVEQKVRLLRIFHRNTLMAHLIKGGSTLMIRQSHLLCTLRTLFPGQVGYILKRAFYLSNIASTDWYHAWEHRRPEWLHVRRYPRLHLSHPCLYHRNVYCL